MGGKSGGQRDGQEWSPGGSGAASESRSNVSGTLSAVCRTEHLFCQTAGYFRKSCIKMMGAFYIDCLGMLKNG